MEDTVVLGRVCVFADRLAPPSKVLPWGRSVTTSDRSRTRNDGVARSFSIPAVDFRLPKANLGMCDPGLV